MSDKQKEPETSGVLGLNVDAGLTREALYELVWSEPMLKVTSQFGVSSSYMARVCTLLYHHPEVPEYPFHDRTIQVTQSGRICMGNRKINLSTVFGGQYVGIREVADKIWLVSFMHYDLGFFDEEDNRLEPVGNNPFAPKVLPMSSE